MNFNVKPWCVCVRMEQKTQVLPLEGDVLLRSVCVCLFESVPVSVYMFVSVSVSVSVFVSVSCMCI